MPRTAPIPNIPAIPGMNPGIVIKAGGGAGGGAGAGKANAKGGKKGAKEGDGKDDAADAKKDAGECGTGTPGGCTGCSPHATRGDPVDLGTGEVFTTESRDLTLPGFVELQFIRQYSSSYASHDVGLGFGWRHPFAWRLQVERRNIVVTKGTGVTATFKTPTNTTPSTYGDWILATGHGRYFLHTPDEFIHVFAPLPGYANTWVLTHISHRNLPGLRLEYDHLGRLTTIIDTAGRHVKLNLNASGRIQEVSVLNPNTGERTIFSRYEYDQFGNLTRHISADSFVTDYTYDEAHRLTSQSYPDGPTYHFVYDAQGRCVESWGAYPGENDPALDPDVPALLRDGTKAKGIHHIRIHYFDDGYVEYFDSVRFQRFQFDASGVAEMASSGAGVTTRVFDENGNTVSKVNANGAQTRYEYDDFGRLSSETNALGEVATVERDVFGRAVRQIDALGGTVEAGYDRLGNLEWLRDQRGALTQYTHSEQGLLVRQVDGVGGVSEYIADAQGNLSQVTLPNGGCWRFEYDYLGRMRRRTDPAGRQVFYGYSVGGNIVRIEQEDCVIQYQRNGFGRITEVFAPEGVYRIRYGGYGWPYEREEPNGDVFRARYNREGWLTKRYDYAGDLTEYKYDLQGLVTDVRYFDGTQEQEHHDPMGNLVKRVAGTQYQMEYTRDVLNRIARAEGDDGRRYSFDYDALGNVVQSETPEGRFDFAYDPTGNLTRDCQYVDGEETWVLAEYDLMGRLIQLESSLGHRENIARNKAGARESLVINGYTHVRYAYDSVGLEVAKVLPGGAQIVSEFDNRYRLKTRGVITSDGTASSTEGRSWLVRRSYLYDASSLLIEATDAQTTTTFTYDPKQRLVSRKANVGVSESFIYDANDNLVQSAPNAPVRRYAQGNRIEAFGEYRFVHDDVGRVTEKRRLNEDGAVAELWTYHWNSQGFLDSVELPNGRYVSFTYDPFGRRVLKEVWSTKDGPLESKTRFVWFSDRMLHEIHSSVGAAPIVRTYLHGDGLPQPWAHRVHSVEPRSDSAQLEAATRPLRQERQGPDDWVFYVSDIIQTPEVLVLGDGTICGELRRTAFGKTVASNPSMETSPIRFVGQYADEETGLHYNHRRYYDPDLARYLSPDPIGLAGGDNLYAYCAGNPISVVDAEGLAKHPATCELDITQGDKKGTWEPHTSGKGTPINPKPGELKSGHTKNGEVHGVPGAARKGAETGGASPGKTENTKQHMAHTEQHALEWATKNFEKEDLQESHMKLSGKLPPCNYCNKAMSQFASTNKSTVDYKWPQNNHVQYKGSEGPTVKSSDPVTGGPGSNSARQKQAVDAMAAAYRESNKEALKDPNSSAGGQKEYWAAKSFFE